MPKLPLLLMYWPSELTTATSTSAMAMSSSARPLTKIRDSVNAVPSVGEARLGNNVGGWSPG